MRRRATTTWEDAAREDMSVTSRAPSASGIGSPSHRDRWASAFVWGVLAVMTAVVLFHIAWDGRNVPLAEDWNMVPPIAGEEPSFWSWVWAQNNEHRLPIARLLYLGVLAVARDFRAGMVLNTLIMAALAAGLVLAARRIRGRTSVVDAFFPLVLLHLGHWANLLFGWQLQLVLTTGMAIGLLLALAGARGSLTTGRIAVACGITALLPLGGGSSLPMVPAAIAALLVVTWGPDVPRRSRQLAIGASVVAVVLSALYFVGWHAATWYPDNPGVRPTLSATAKVVALAWGPAAEGSFRLSVLLSAVVLGAVLVVLVRALRERGGDRRAALALLALLGGTLLTAGAVGYGRAALVPTEGLPHRYVIVTVPILVVAWFAWHLFGPARIRFAAQAGLLAVVLVLVPLNADKGYQFRDWYDTGMTAVEQDLVSGTPVDVMVARHSDFLMHWNDDALAARMRMLHDEGIGPFADLEVSAR